MIAGMEFRIRNEMRRAGIAFFTALLLAGCGPRSGAAQASGKPERLQAALEMKESPAREDALVALFAEWSVSDPQGLDKELAGWPRGDARWGRALPALQRVLPAMNGMLGKDPALVQLVSLVSGACARQDPDAAAAWARKSLGRAGRDVAFAVIVEELALESPERATRLTDEIADPVIKLDAIYAIGASLGAAKPEAALAWVRTLPAENQTDAAKAAIEGWARVRPRDALAYALRENDAPGMRAVFEQWTSAAPGDAALAARALADPKVRQAAIGTVVEAAEQAIPVDAAPADWAQRLPAGPGRDAMDASLADRLVVADPGGAWSCAQAIGDAKMRGEVRRAVIAAVAADDPDIARKLIDGDRSLPSGDAAALRSLVAP